MFQSLGKRPGIEQALQATSRIKPVKCKGLKLFYPHLSTSCKTKGRQFNNLECT